MIECGPYKRCVSWLMDEVCVCESDFAACQELELSIFECTSQTHNCDSGIICDGTRATECQSMMVTRDIWHVLLYEPIDWFTPTKIDWVDEYSVLYSIPAVKAKIDLTKVIHPIFSIVAAEITGRLKLELGSVEFYDLRQSNDSKLEVSFQSGYLYRHRVKVDASIPMDRLYSFADIPELKKTADYITATINQRFFQAFNSTDSWLKLDSSFRFTYQILTWDEYMLLQRNNLLRVPWTELPEMLQHVINCHECYFMPSLVMNLRKESVTPPEVSMMNSLQGTIVDVDLCMAKSRKLFFTVNAFGQPPFQKQF